MVDFQSIPQRKYTVELNTTGFVDISTTNLYARITDVSMAVGLHERKNRGLALLSYDPELDFDMQLTKAKSLVEKLFTSFKKPEVILVGHVPQIITKNPMLEAFRDYFGGHKMLVDDRTHFLDIDEVTKAEVQIPIGTKELVLGPMNARVIARNLKGGYNLGDSITDIDYLKIK